MFSGESGRFKERHPVGRAWGGDRDKSQPYLVGSRSSWASQKRNEVEKYGAAVAQYIRSRKLTAIIGLSGFNMSESSGFARVNKNGSRSVGNKPGTGAGVSDVVLHPRHATVCGRRRNTSHFTSFETAHSEHVRAQCKARGVRHARDRFSAVSGRLAAISGSLRPQSA